MRNITLGIYVNNMLTTKNLTLPENNVATKCALLGTYVR